MKLLQYRFSEADVSEASYVGEQVKSFLERVNDLNLEGIFSIAAEPKGLKRKRLQPQGLALIVEESFQQSYITDKIDYSKSASIRSLESCRFIVFEDDGLMRVCYSTEDDSPTFPKLTPRIDDVSNLLIETDLFDFL